MNATQRIEDITKRIAATSDLKKLERLCGELKAACHQLEGEIKK